MKDWYKIVDLIDGNVRTLFHGLHGNKTLPVGKWLQAVMKPVSDGGTIYTSGWHIVPSLEECIGYLNRFKNTEPKAVVLCKAKNVWPKAHSPSNIYLSEHLYIEKVVWRLSSVR